MSMENTLKYFQGRCKDLKMCLDTCRDKDGLEKAIAHNEKAGSEKIQENAAL